MERDLRDTCVGVGITIGMQTIFFIDKPQPPATQGCYLPKRVNASALTPIPTHPPTSELTGRDVCLWGPLHRLLAASEESRRLLPPHRYRPPSAPSQSWGLVPLRPEGPAIDPV